MLSEEQFGFNAFWWERLYTDEEISRAVECLAKLGYKGVEWKEVSFNPQKKLAEEFKRARHITEKAGLKVSNFVILRDIVNPENKEKGIADIKNCIEATGEAGIDKLNMVSSGCPKGISEGEAWTILLSSLEELLKTAEKHKVYLVLEACAGQIVHDYYSTRELFSKIDSPYLCLTMDPSHYFLYRNDIPWAIRQWGDKIKHVHMKDAVGIPGPFGVDFLFPILGEGGIDWVSFLKALNDINYKGFLSCEFEAFLYYERMKMNPCQAAEISMKSLKGLFNLYLSS